MHRLKYAMAYRYTSRVLQKNDLLFSYDFVARSPVTQKRFQPKNGLPLDRSMGPVVGVVGVVGV